MPSGIPTTTAESRPITASSRAARHGGRSPASAEVRRNAPCRRQRSSRAPPAAAASSTGTVGPTPSSCGSVTFPGKNVVRLMKADQNGKNSA